MSNVNVADRLEFLAEKFDVFEADEKSVEEKLEEFVSNGATSVGKVMGHSNNTLALISITETAGVHEEYGEYKRVKQKISVSYDVFKDMVDADTTKNKQTTQWMLNVFTRYIKNKEKDEAVRFVEEDLPLAKEYLEMFEANKKKKKFKELCKTSYVLKDVKDATNINQYKSLSQLYDAVDPFIERDPSEMEKLLNKFVDSGQATIPVRDRKFTVFVPKTREANVVFDKFAGWCTAKPKNGMFKSYTEDIKYKKPNGQNSDIYIVIDNRFFDGELEDNHLYQLHFESRQVRNRKQNNKGNFFEDVINRSEGVANYFYEELMGMAKMKGTNTNNIYVDYLIKFGWTEALFEMIEEFTPIIRFENRDVVKLPDLSRFKQLESLIIHNAKLSNIHPSVGNLDKLIQILMPKNRITALPKELGQLKNLYFINVMGSEITDIPEEIKYLDPSNGGKLIRFACDRDLIGEANYQKLRRLLPNVEM